MFNKGQRLQKEKALAVKKVWNKIKGDWKRANLTYRDFQHSDFWKDIYRATNINQISRIIETNEIPGSSDSDNLQPGPSNQFDDREWDSTDFDNLLSELADTPDMANIQNNIPNPSNPVGTSQGGAQSNRMEVDGMSSGQGSEVGGRSSTNPSLPVLAPVPRNTSNTLIYKKRWYHYTYGIAHTVLDQQPGDAATTWIDNHATPYCCIPVDFLPYYLTLEEYTRLPYNAYAKKLKAQVTLIGTRTSFDTGTTLSTTATTEYVPIVKYAIGANVKLPIRNTSYTFNDQKPMVPNGIDENESMKKICEQLYSWPSAYEIPRHLNRYMTYIVNGTSQDKNSPGTLYKDSGLMRIDQWWKTAMVNNVLGEILINYEYKPKNGLLTTKNKVPLTNYAGNVRGLPAAQNIIQLSHWRLPHTLTYIRGDGTSVTASDPTYLSQGVGNMAYAFADSPPNLTWMQSIERGPVISLTEGTTGSYVQQPQIHLGLLATPALKPGNAKEDFLNSSLYFYVDVEIEIGFKNNFFHTRDLTDWPNEATFIQAIPKGYQGYGCSQFGLHSFPNTIVSRSGATTQFAESSEQFSTQQQEPQCDDSDESDDFEFISKKRRSKKIHKKLQSMGID